jgi:hypothetical protein
MKTTLDIDDRLLREAKAAAAKEQKSLTRLIEEGLALRLRAAARPPRKGLVKLPLLPGNGGFLPGIDPKSNKSILDAIDDDA